MTICDRCIMAAASMRLQIRSLQTFGDSHPAEVHCWDLCEECADTVSEAARELVECYYPGRLHACCPSLTPEQAKQVELYYRSKRDG